MIEGLIVLMLGQSYCNLHADVLEERGQVTVIRACAHGTLREYTQEGGFLDQAIEAHGKERPDIVLTDFGEKDITHNGWLRKAKKKKLRRKMSAWMVEFDGYLDRVSKAWGAPVLVVQTGRWIESRRHRLWRSQARVRGMQAIVAGGHPAVCALGNRWNAGKRLSKQSRWKGHHDGYLVADLLEPAIVECAP